jgi:hypothetical protein
LATVPFDKLHLYDAADLTACGYDQYVLHQEGPYISQQE